MNGNATAPSRPTKRFMSGSIVVSVWENEGQYGPMHSIAVQHIYFDEQANEWKYTNSLPANQLLQASKALDIADTWCSNRKTEYRNAAATRTRQDAASAPTVESPPASAPATSRSTQTIKVKGVELDANDIQALVDRARRADELEMQETRRYAAECQATQVGV